MAPSPAAPRLHVVTGKGGTGKTTVASAIAVAHAARGRRVLLAEVEERQGISQTFDVAPLDSDERLILRDPSGGRLHAMSVDARSALMEYLQKFYRLGRAGGVLQRVGAVDFATTIAPGLRDVLLVGKVYEAVGRREGGRGREGGRPAYDVVVLDAPPTGRVVRFLNVNAEMAQLARVGPIHQQAQRITKVLRSDLTTVHVVTLLEEMPVQETVETIRELTRSGFHVGAIVVNRVHEPLVPDATLTTLRSGRTGRLRTGVRSDLKRAGTDPGDDLVDGLLAQGADHATRVALEEEQERIILEEGRPVHHLPELPDGVDPADVHVLAATLTEQGMA